MTARDRIFAEIVQRLGPRDSDAGDIAAEAAALVADMRAIQPEIDMTALIDRFIAKSTSERVTASVERLDGLAQVPGAVARYARTVGLEASAAVQPTPAFDALDWAGLKCTPRATLDQALAVTLAEYGVAETGSLVFRSGPDAPALLNFLPLHHIAVLREDDILAHIEDVWPRLGGPDAPQSRLLTLITGTSGTADIEAQNIRGAHGPRYMHILLVAGIFEKDNRHDDAPKQEPSG